jgi:uncharacterized protein
MRAAAVYSERAIAGPVFCSWKGANVLVPMELARIVISEINDQQVVFLKEIDGDRSFPILIGIFEASSIDRRVQGRVTGELPPRPLTHDLLKQAIEELGGDAEDVVINNLMDHTYFAVIRVRKDGELIELDARPSDAIALAVHYDPFLPIYVEDTVLAEVT